MTGDELRREREELGLTQAQLAEVLGTTANTIARWERGERAVNEGWARLAFEALALQREAKALGAELSAEGGNIGRISDKLWSRIVQLVNRASTRT